mgnify:CR=1 FL=1
MSQDILMDRITAAIGQLHAGDREGTRASFDAIWLEMGDRPDPFHVCTLSHYMADAQDDVARELEWDLRALEAAERVTDGRAKQHHASLSIKSFYPSLHLNVGDAFLRLGNLDDAEKHVRAAENALRHLPESPLSDLTRKGVTALAERVRAARG